MSRQDKATTERFTRTLRELVKKPENKVCADCKRNDPRWASWNLGVFLCIRCSGIHRGMGTHISKVKSVDLDTWTPEQMQNIQKWGNHLANLYWEAHLKAGHAPPEHKMESFIRSKYEMRRWAIDGPLPLDPSTLDTEMGSASAAPPPVASSPPHAAAPPYSSSRPTHAPSHSLSSSTGRQAVAPATTRQPVAHQLLSSNYTNRPAHGIQAPVVAPPPQQQQQAPSAPENDLFSLDFHAPPVAQNAPPEQKKDVKQDILSLFSAHPPSPAPSSAAFGQFNNQAAYWGGVPQQQQQPQFQHQQQQAQTTSMAGMNGTGMWGASSGWAAPVVPAQTNVWGTPAAVPTPHIQQQQQANLFNTNAVWGSSGASNAAAPASQDLFGSFASQPAAQKKDDAFGDLWGNFK